MAEAVWTRRREDGTGGQGLVVGVPWRCERRIGDNSLGPVAGAVWTEMGKIELDHMDPWLELWTGRKMMMG